ncbi:hypothetical protein CERSUDRAFT_100702 [Gelatoporia subvermispora B]|uniref:Uncharacterized protein n=1 Tax=Ceriporiopsis subvermispora (strain B) TaxID=914234 RepID=M2QX90_CERS8|nr:hypothetical protein CERSUDRAFT_100702 [Gelatoporia subvermispora B]
MLLTNQRLDKLAASRADFKARGMLLGTCYSDAVKRLERLSMALFDVDENDPQNSQDEAESERDSGTESDEEGAEDGNEDTGVVQGPLLASVTLARRPQPHYPRTMHELGTYMKIPEFSQLVTRFLHERLDPADIQPLEVSSFRVFHSSVAIFRAPSDISGIEGLRRERIRATPSWCSGPGRYDCIFAETDENSAGFRGLLAARVKLFFSFKHVQQEWPCALVEWFSPVGTEPDQETGMWIVEPDLNNDGIPICDIIHVESILRGAHLIGVAGRDFIPRNLRHYESLDAFQSFYVNKYADHHTHEIAF